jgi:hypothetical protein
MPKQQTNKVVTYKRPSPALVKLIESGCDGGYGEFEKYLPKECRTECDSTWYPEINGHTVVWFRIQ